MSKKWQRGWRSARAATFAVGWSAAAGLTAAAEPPRIDPRDLTGGDPFYYTADQQVGHGDGQKELVGTGRPNRTHSQVPHLPSLSGYMNTNYTYRFISVTEQVLTMIGEGKHGVWRVGENGHVRMYRRKGAPGLAQGADPLNPANQLVVQSDYGSFLAEERFDGYKYPDQQLSEDGRLNFIDLPITHALFRGKYDRHEPIDLPSYYCTMSEADYPYARTAMDFAFSQPAAGNAAMGPLGRRAGLDVDENYTKVLRLEHFPDARSWVNVGVPGKDASHVRWAAVDTAHTKAEYYLVERPFFNVPYLFLFAVYENDDNADFRYVRPDGPYYEWLRKAGAKPTTTLTQAPRFHIEGGTLAKSVGLPLYGVHHPNRAVFGGGGACPLKGGDWGRYPKVGSGSGWPTQYEEVTPLCDAVLLDIKFYSNLDGQNWNAEDKYLANAGVGTREVKYRVEPGHYGAFSDPYNTKAGHKNPDERDVPAELTLTFPAVKPAVGYTRPPPLRRAEGEVMPTASTSCRPIPGIG